MAASLRQVWPRLLSRRFSRSLRVNYLSTVPQLFPEDLPIIDVPTPVEYPPVKPKYPPGKWGKLLPKRAWQIHEEAEEIIKETTSVKFRLEKLAGDSKAKQPHRYGMKMINVQSDTLKYKQYVTKTHTITGLPDELYTDVDVGQDVLKLRSLIVDEIENEVDQYKFTVNEDIISPKVRYKLAHRIMGRILALAVASLSSEHSHLLRSQFDENVRVAAFWKRCGYENIKGVSSATWGDIINLQYANHVNYQVRTELPLPEILPMDDPICTLGDVPDYLYSPTVAGQAYRKERPISIAGHWVGDPCEFGHLTCIVANSLYDTILETRGEAGLDEDSVGWGLAAGFGNTVAQAHNQGFFHYADITYPFVNQLLVTDGRWVRFHVYQLNTLFLWKDNEANPLRNLLWSSPRMPLYDVIEDGRVKGFNDDTLRQLFKCLLVRPEERGVDMRPYIQQAAADINKQYMNEIGQAPFPHIKPGRFEYPRNAVYF